jgi:hypothetical protein
MFLGKAVSSDKALKILVLVSILGILLLGNNILWTIEANAEDMPLVAKTLVSAAKFVTNFAFWMIVVTLVIAGMYGLGKYLLGLLETGEEADEAEQEVQEVRHVVENNLHGIQAALSRLEADRTTAMERIQEAQNYSNQLLRVIGAAMRKYERMTARAESFSEAMSALAGGDLTRIAAAAGKIEDGQMRTLMLELLKNGDEAFRNRLEQMIAAQLGVVQRNAAAYRRLALQCMPQLSDYKVQYERLLAVHDGYDIVEPMLLVGEHLRQAQAYLELPMHEHQQIRTMPVGLIEAE